MLQLKGVRAAAYAIAATATCSLAPAAQAQSLIQNGSFEAGFAFWTPSGAGSITPTSTAHATDGGMVMVFSGQNGTLSQQFTSSAGNFDYRFAAGRSEAFGPFDDVPLSFVARIDGVVLSNVLPIFDSGSGGRTTGTRLFSTYIGSLALGAGLHTLSFEYSRQPTQFGRDPFLLLDGVSLTPQALGGVPEPSAWALLILGFGAIGAGLRARRLTGVSARADRQSSGRLPFGKNAVARLAGPPREHLS